MSKASDGLGRWGEEVAAAFLTSVGMQVLETRWRCRDGEVDIIARDGRALVFCEVKTRRGTGFGVPIEAVTATKQRRLRRLAGAWLAAHEAHAEDIRFDVVGVLTQAGAPQIVHVPAAF